MKISLRHALMLFTCGWCLLLLPAMLRAEDEPQPHPPVEGSTFADRNSQSVLELVSFVIPCPPAKPNGNGSIRVRRPDRVESTF